MMEITAPKHMNGQAKADEPLHLDHQPKAAATVNLLDEDDIDIRSEEASEVLGSAPNWMIRFGVSVVLVTMLIITGIAYLIKYPDKVTTDVWVVTQQPPVSLTAKSTGLLQHLLVKDKQQVGKGEPLAVIENPARYADVQVLMAWFTPFWRQVMLEDKVVRKALPDRKLELGELERPFDELVNSLQKYGEKLASLQIKQRQITQLQGQIKVQQQLQRIFTSKQALKHQQFALTQKHYQANVSLLEKEAISQVDFDQAQEQYLNAKLTLEDLKEQAIQSTKELERIKEEIIAHQHQLSEEKSAALQEVKRATTALEYELKSWQDKVLIQAPIAGRVALHKFWATHQRVNTSDEVMSILPETGVSVEPFAYGYLAEENSGKVKEGQTVHIQFHNYPSKEFGVVKGILIEKSSMAREGKYLVRIQLPEGLRTSYGHQLTFSQEMKGGAAIITHDVRLIERLLYKIKGLWVEV